MTMHRPNSLIRIRNAPAQRLQHISVQFRHTVTDGIGKIDCSGTFRNDRFNHAAQEIHVGATAILGTKFNIISEFARETHCEFGLFKHLIRRHAQLFFHMQWRSRNECMNAFARCRRKRFRRPRNIAIIGARQRTHCGILDHAGNSLDRLKISLRRSRKTRFDYVHFQALQLFCDADFFILGHRSTWRLFAIP